MKYFTDPSKLKKTSVISLDTEYDNIEVRHANLLSISVGTSSDDAGIFHANDLKSITPQLQAAEIIFTQNGKVDWWILKQNGLELDRSKFIDTMLLEHLIDENVGHGLGEMAVRYFEDDYKSRFWSTYRTYEEAPRQEQLEYELRDACFTFRLGKRFYSEIANPELIKHVHRLYWALFETELTGLKVDVDLINKTKSEMGPEIERLKSSLFDNHRDYVNIWTLNKWKEKIDKLVTDNGKSNCRKPSFSFSDPQLQWLIYDALKYPIFEKTKKKKPSTKMKHLIQLNEYEPGIEDIIDYKSLKSAYPTFVVGLSERVKNGRIYPSFDVNGTTTGRISHYDPNMSNMPKKGVFRNFFIPDEGMALIGGDYSQLEVMVEANITNDPQLLKIALEGADKHTLTAEAVGWPRDKAKTLNFLLQYGGGEWKIQKTFGTSKSEAKETYERYWLAYSGVKVTKEKVFEELRQNGFVVNLFGRSRHFPTPENDYEQGRFERQAYSHIVQGPGGDMTSMAFYKVNDHLRAKGWGVALWTVHDEIIAQVKKEHAEEAKAALTEIMESVNDYVNFKYRVKAVPYGPLDFWKKT